MKGRILNINVGVLGHVDSGKTSLVAALSTQLSTAALDKHPQSQERGITLDLGFSSFTVALPEELQPSLGGHQLVQFTLVDCPGHASLIRTIIGGVQIIDLMLLVVDVTKGIQTQTAECLVVGEVAAGRMVVALNKVDLLPEDTRPKGLKKMQRRIRQTLDLTRFSGAAMVPTSANPGCVQGIEDLKALLVAQLDALPPRRKDSPLLISVDHCFPLKGQGTVLTGTVLQGSVSVGQLVELPALKIQRAVRSIQVFKKPVNTASAGDRIGLSLPQLDPALLERGMVAAPGSVPTFSGAIMRAEKIRFFAGKVASKSKFHVSIGHTTVMTQLLCFGLPNGRGVAPADALAGLVQHLEQLALHGAPPDFNFAQDYLYQDELYGLEGRPAADEAAPCRPEDGTGMASNSDDSRHFGPQWLLLMFEQPITAPKDALAIGSKLDADPHGEACRLAFCGRLCALLDPGQAADLQRLRVFKTKRRQGVIERVEGDGDTAVCRGMFKKETDQTLFRGLQVVTWAGEVGMIESAFGKSGKFRVRFARPLGKREGRSADENRLVLEFKKYIYDTDKRSIRQ